MGCNERDEQIDFRVELTASYTCPNYLKSKPRAAASNRMSSGGVSNG
jgi:hypothetical protein